MTVEAGHPVVVVHRGGAATVHVLVDRPVEIGRACDGLLVDDPAASRRHLVLRPDGPRCIVEDLGSSNGTLLNGTTLTAPTPLGPDDEVRFGDVVVRLSDLAAVPGSASPTVPAGARDTVVHPVGDAPARATAIASLAEVLAGDEPVKQQLDQLGSRYGQTLTFFFSDIESSTEAAQRLGDHQWFEVLQAHDQVMRDVVGRHRGTVVKSLGDGLMCTFPTTHDALQAAGLVGRALEAADVPVRVRIGLHTGEAIASGDDLFGLHVNVAARVADLAVGGQVLVSSVTRTIAETAGYVSFGPEEQVTLKGIAGRWGVSALQGPGSREDPTPPG